MQATKTTSLKFMSCIVTIVAVGAAISKYSSITTNSSSKTWNLLYSWET